MPALPSRMFGTQASTQSDAPGLSLLALGVGNSRTRWGIFSGRELIESASEPNGASLSALLADRARAAGVTRVALASVNDQAADPLARALAGVVEGGVVRIGRDIAPPLRHSLDDASTLGIDRALCACAAWELLGSACAVIDAGTAITVDFIDGEGVFQGGAISPGLNLMLRALGEHTSSLPTIGFTPPDPGRGPFGKDTRHAMLLGVMASARGMVRDLVERYAEAYGAYPRVIATGGDAQVLFEGDGLVERLVPDLQLIGVQRTLEAALRDQPEEF